MVEWLAGNRIRGTSAEKPVLGLQSPSVGGWVEVGRTTLGSGNANISVSSIPDKRYYMVLNDLRSSSAINGINRVGNSTLDTGSNYAERQSNNGGADSPLTSQAQAPQYGTLAGNSGFGVDYIANLATKEKLGISHVVDQNTAGAGTAPERVEHAWKWTNTSNVIDILEKRTSVNTYNTGSEVVVLGWDPADTHTTNFWEELASVDLSGGAASSIDSGTITAKKYLWFQVYVDGSTVNNRMHIRMNGLSTGIYADRYNLNGGTDGTDTSSGSARISDVNDLLPKFVNGFIVNNSSNEKLGIAHEVSQNTAGAGTAPQRSESVFKIANTSAQITSLQLINLSGNWGTGSYFKVWGSN